MMQRTAPAHQTAEPGGERGATGAIAIGVTMGAGDAAHPRAMGAGGTPEARGNQQGQ
jgi:hypothetical protein